MHRLPQVVDQVLRVFEADGQAHQAALVRPASRRAHGLHVVGHGQAHRAAPGIADLEELQGVDEGIDLSGGVARIEHHAEQPGGGGAVALPVRMAGAAGQRRVEHLRHLGLVLHPQRDAPRAGVLRGIAQRQGMQAAQHAGDVVRANAQAEPHVGEQQAFVQGIVAGGHAAHEQVGAAALVFGKGLHHHIHAEIEGLQRDAGSPSGVDGGEDAVLPCHGDESAQIGHFHGHRTGRFQPEELGLRRDQLGEFFRGASGFVDLVLNAPGPEKALGQFAARAVHIARQQHRVALLQQSEIDQGDGRKTRGAEHAVAPAIEHGQTLLQDERGGGAVQPVGIAGLAAPVARAHRGHIWEDHGGGMVHAGLHRTKTGWRLIRVMLQTGGQMLHFGGRLGFLV